MKHWSEKLVSINACSDAVKWARKQPSAAVAWKTCKRGDWMLWLIGKLHRSEPYSEKRKPIVRIACECARLALEWMPHKSRDALEVIEKWTRGEASTEDCMKARSAAYAAADASYAASYAAADASYAAAYASYAASYAAANAAANAAADASSAAANAAAAKCASIVRKHYPKAPRLP